MPSWLASCKKEEIGPEIKWDGKVAIIGAGVAGLYAADILHSKGLQVTVFEASSQLGGRVRSLHNQSVDLYPNINKVGADYPVELGAELIYGTTSAWGKIASDYRVPLVDLTTTTSSAFILDGTVTAEADLRSDNDYLAAINFISAIPGATGDGSVASAVTAAGLSARAQAIVEAMVGNLYGTNNSKLSYQQLGDALTLRSAARDSKVYSLKANIMQDLVISRFSTIQDHVKLSTPIVAIDYSADQVTLTDKSGTTSIFDKVLVTIPLNIIKSGSVSFNPALPASMQSSLNKLGMDACVRVVLDFNKNFWGDTFSFIWGDEWAPQVFSAGIGRSQFDRTMNITVCGERARQLSDMGEGMIDQLLLQLDTVYAGQATKYLRYDLENPTQRIYVIQDWGKEEFIKGGWSYPTPGATAQDRINIGQPLGKKLFFAGEATDINGEWGTISGALLSAERATEEMIAAIKGV